MLLECSWLEFLSSTMKEPIIVNWDLTITMIDSLRVNIQLLREEIWEERLIGEEEDRNIERGEDI